MLHSNHNEMHAVIQEEEVLKKELEWLLDTQLPNAIYNIKKVLKLIDAQNYITLALDALECSNNLLTKERSYEMLDTVLKNISNARFILTCANEEKLFPYKICDPQFHIEGSYIVVSVYALQYHSSPPQQKHGNILGSSKSPLKV
ncbi:105_t:CDS:2, partial [Gigaspora rosea]